MSNRHFIDWVRDLVAYLQDGGEFSDAMVEEVESMQDQFSATFSKYEEQETPELATPLRDLMMEALQFMHDGLDDLLEFDESDDETLLAKGLALVEEGNDILDSLRYAVEQDTSWTSQSALG